MATGEVWMKNISELTDDEVETFKNSIRNLLEWPLFYKELHGSSLRSIGDILEDEQDNREVASHYVKEDEPKKPMKDWNSKEDVIAQMKTEVLECMTEGQIPFTVTTFSELHDHIDANELGGFCDDDCPYDSGSDEDIGFMNDCQGAIDLWLRSEEFTEKRKELDPDWCPICKGEGVVPSSKEVNGMTMVQDCVCTKEE